MSPELLPRLCLCVSVCLYLFATCSARPNWHQGVLLVKDTGLPPLPLQHQSYQDQFNAAKAIQDAGENAQLHLAFLKKKYMDIIRQQFYQSLAPVPIIREQMDHLKPNLNVQPIKTVPLQPIFIHQVPESRRCAGNILNCLNPNIPSRLGKIIPSPSSGNQPCFSPYCNHISLNPQIRPDVFPKPSHISYSMNGKPSKVPHKHHRICDRKKPGLICHHRTTFWPTYATLKFPTKLNQFPTVSPKVINRLDNLLPLQTSEDHETVKSNLMGPIQLITTEDATTISSKTGNKSEINNLKMNTTDLENEILGISQKGSSKNGINSPIKFPSIFKTTSLSMTEPLSSTRSDIHLNIQTANYQDFPSEAKDTPLDTGLDEDNQNIPPLKNYKNYVPQTTQHSFNKNDVLEKTSQETPKTTYSSVKRYEEESVTSNSFFQTSSPGTEAISEDNLRLTVNFSKQVEITTTENSRVLEQTTLNNWLEHKYPTTTINKEDYEGKTESSINNFYKPRSEKIDSADTTDISFKITNNGKENEWIIEETTQDLFDNKIKEEDEIGSTTVKISSLREKTIVSQPTTIDHSPEAKTEFVFVGSENPFTEVPLTSTNYYTGNQKAVSKYSDSNVNEYQTSDQQSAIVVDYFPGELTSFNPSVKTVWNGNGENSYTTIRNIEGDVTRMFDNDLAKTPVEDVLVKPTKPMFEYNQEINELQTQLILKDNDNLDEINQKNYTDPQESKDISLNTLVPYSKETTGKNDIKTQEFENEDTSSSTLRSNSVENRLFEKSTIESSPNYASRTEENSYLTAERSHVVSGGTESEIIKLEDTSSNIYDSSNFETSTYIPVIENEDGKSNQEKAREESFMNPSPLDAHPTTTRINELQSTKFALEMAETLPPHFNENNENEIGSTEDSHLSVPSQRSDLIVDVDLSSIATGKNKKEISTQSYNDVTGPISMVRENNLDLESMTKQGDYTLEGVTVKELSLTSAETFPSSTSNQITTTLTDFIGFSEPMESKELKIGQEQEGYSFKYPTQNSEEWTTHKSDLSEYLPLAREEISQNNDYFPINSEKSTTASSNFFSVAEDEKNEETSTQANGVSEPIVIIRVDDFESVTKEDFHSTLQEVTIKQLNVARTEEFPTSTSNPSSITENDTSDFHVTVESKELKNGLEDEEYLLNELTTENTEERTTLKSDSPEYFPLAKEKLSQNNYYPLISSEEPTTDSVSQTIPGSDQTSFSTTSTQNVDELIQGETVSPLPEVVEIRTEHFSTDTMQPLNIIKYSDELAENVQGTSSVPIDADIIKDAVTDNSFSEHPQLRESGEKDLDEPIKPVDDNLKTKESVDKQEEETIFLTTMENKYEDNTEGVINVPTEISQRRDNYESTTVTMKDYTDSFSTEFEQVKVNEMSLPNEIIDNTYESNLMLPKELFGKTDTPGLLLGKDWMDELTEETSLDDLTQDVSTSQPSIKAEAIIPETFSETTRESNITVEVGEDTNYVSAEFKLNENLETTPESSSNTEVFNKNSALTTLKDFETTTSVTLLSHDPSLHPDQDGVLKFTTEIENETENVLETMTQEGSIHKTIPAIVDELNDRKKREVRSVGSSRFGQIKNEIQSYPTTQCILCILGLPHGHRISRSSENNRPKNIKSYNETRVLHDKSRNNCSMTTTLEDSETSSVYASTILELLPVIREGYRNNAFSEEDKKVIRSIFGDMKTLIDDEDTLERLSEATGDLLMGDETSRTEDIIEDVDYDSSESNEDVTSEKDLRPKRSKKTVHLLNDPMKNMQGNLKTQLIDHSKLKSSRNIRSTQVSEAEAGAILALLAEKGDAVELDLADDEDDDEYEYYEDEGDEYGDEDSRYIDVYEDDYDKPSFGELIKLARKHRERKSRAEQS